VEVILYVAISFCGDEDDNSGKHNNCGRAHWNQFPLGAAAANWQKSDFGKLVAGGKQPASALHSCFDAKSIEFTALGPAGAIQNELKIIPRKWQRASLSLSIALTHSARHFALSEANHNYPEGWLNVKL
jgi:hypothetical protein